MSLQILEDELFLLLRVELGVHAPLERLRVVEEVFPEVLRLCEREVLRHLLQVVLLTDDPVEILQDVL